MTVPSLEQAPLSGEAPDARGLAPGGQAGSGAARPTAPSDGALPGSGPLGSPRAARFDQLGLDEVLALLPGLPIWPAAGNGDRQKRLRGARRVLVWLQTQPGQGWQQRWHNGGADAGTAWIDELAPGLTHAQRCEAVAGLRCLLLLGVVAPGYRFLADYRAMALFTQVRTVVSPQLFVRVEQAGRARGLHGQALARPLGMLAKMVLHTGRDLDALRGEDFTALHDWSITAIGRSPHGLAITWDLLADVVELDGDRPALWAGLRRGQRSPAELIDRYPITARPVRDLLVRYLGERQPGVDHSTLLKLATTLARTFWGDIEAHHPGVETVALPRDVIEAWMARLQETLAPRGTTRNRLGRLEVLFVVRGFYLDVAEWAVDDPSWAPWAVPCPIRRRDIAGRKKHRAATQAQMHQRVRDRLPQLPVLIEAAHRQRERWARLLTAAASTAVGEMVGDTVVPDNTATPADDTALGETAGPQELVGLEGGRYRRVARKSHTGTRAPLARDPAVADGPVTIGTVIVEDLTTGEVLDASRREDEAFWAWAVIEILRHTGIRIEELLELTQLALVSYRLPATGEVVPLLQIVPSKTNEERLLLVSTELASVLASVLTRLRRENGGTVALVTRWDPHERVFNPPLPHLLQRRQGPTRRGVPTPGTIHRLLAQTVTHAGLRDGLGQPTRFTPHDFRRMFATETVTGGLPVHITARILGHHNLATTQSYLAVFQDELIRTYRAYLDRRRAVRPAAEYREPTATEWQQFQAHFELRKLELGTCGRPYGTPCQHEHACIRCPMLRVDPRQRARLIEIVRNLGDRITEARAHGWLGEIEGLQHSLNEGRKKLAALNRATSGGGEPGGTTTSTITDLGIPVISGETPSGEIR